MKLGPRIDEILGNKAAVRLLRSFLARPSVAQSGRAWARTAGLSLPSAARELRLLHRHGLLMQEIRAHENLWELNRGHHLLVPLKQLFQAEAGHEALLKEIARKAARRSRGLKGIVVYGSRARGDARPESDLDLIFLVDSEGDRPTGIAAASQVISDASSLLGLSVAPLVFTRKEWAEKCNPSFVEAVRRDGQPIWGAAT